MLLLALSVTLLRCSEDESATLQEDVAVTFNFSAKTAANGRVTAETPDVLYLSLLTSTGEPYVTYKKVKILSVGETYISEPVILPTGSYQVSDFLLADEESDSVLFAVPKKGSLLAKFVSRPLPSAFVVTRDKITNIAMEVIDVSTSTPADFGYTAFQIQKVSPLQLSVFVQDASATSLVTGRAYLLTGDDTTNVYDLGAKVNSIGIPGDPQATHTLVIRKPGYGVYKQTFTYNDLPAKSISAFLSPAFTVIASVHQTSGHFAFSTLDLSSGSVHVDWGDGTANDSTGHLYTADGDYVITITGDLDKITDLGIYYYPFLEIDLSRLTGLKNLRMGITGYPPYGLKAVDLSKNVLLERVTLEEMPTLKTFTLPSPSNLADVRLMSLPLITTAILDNAITKVYQATQLNPKQGRFEYYNWTQGVGYTPLGPPSADGLVKLNLLRYQYGWTITALP